MTFSEFLNFINGSFIDNSIEPKLNYEMREIDLFSKNKGIVKVNQKNI